MSRAIVIGGGLAGISAAFALRDQGHRVELCESRQWLGGRAFSPPDRGLSYRLDNGPHVMLGCYHEMRALLRRIGSEQDFEAPRRLRLAYRDGGGRASALRLGPGPAPLQFGPALFGIRGLSFGEKLRALRGLMAVLRSVPADWSVDRWIEARGQQGGPRRYLWDPMCRAIVNAEPAEVDANLFLYTLRRAFLGSGADAAIWHPTKPWSEIVGEPARRQLEAEGIELQFGKRLAGIVDDGQRVTALEFGDGERIELGAEDLLVSALPWSALHQLRPEFGAGLGRSSITSLYFDFEQDPGLPDDPLTALVDGSPFHYLLRRPGGGPGAVALLNGGGAGVDGLSVEAIEVGGREQLRRYFPEARGLDGGRARVMKEARATILAVPGSAALRPKPGRAGGLANFRVCGDWTGTRLPSTLEGAVISGRLAVAGQQRRYLPGRPW